MSGRMIEDGLVAGEVGLTVYSPDAHHSGLFGAIDHFVGEHSSLRPIHRSWFAHDAASIERFYQPVVQNNLPNWHLVSELFVGRPSVLTLWQGPNAIEQLTRLKGKSHPSRARAGTLRSRFWVDNAICNLIHVSDSQVELARELRAIDALHLLKGAPAEVAVFETEPNSSARVVHSGLLAFARVLARTECSDRAKSTAPALLEDDDAAKNFQHLRSCLERMPLSPRGSELVRMFLAGDYHVERYLKATPAASSWERFVASCCLRGMPAWTGKALLHDVVASLGPLLAGADTWFVGGSSALYLHGFECAPRDLDVTCSRSSLERIADKLGLELVEQERAFGTYLSASYRLDGWDVEFSTFSSFRGRYRFEIDRELLARVGHVVPVTPLEDVVVELLAMNRRDGKDDADRARAVVRTMRGRLDREYLAYRLRETGVDGRILDD
jgi:nucleoside diphosphate kinase